MTNTTQMLIKKATHGDLPEIYQLLEELNLPIIGVSDHLDNFFMSMHGSKIVGLIGLEVYSNVALLRSVGVKPSYQGNKVGDELVLTMIEYARFKSIQKLYLFTDTAADWFKRYGFIQISNDQLDPILEESHEFSLCQSSVKMIKIIDSSEGQL